MHAVLSKIHKAFKHNIQLYSGYKNCIKKYVYEKVVDLAEPVWFKCIKTIACIRQALGCAGWLRVLQQLSLSFIQWEVLVGVRWMSQGQWWPMSWLRWMCHTKKTLTCFRPIHMLERAFWESKYLQAVQKNNPIVPSGYDIYTTI